MIIHIYEQVSNLNINRQTVRVLRVYNRNVPEGITESAFTAKGDILVGTGDGTYTAFPAGANGTYLKYDDTQPGGVTTETPTFTVTDTTNHLINGGFLFAQDQDPATFTTKSDGGYSADQWKITRENAALQYIRQDATGETGLTSRYYGQYKKITNAGKFLICQPLEYMDSLKFRGNDISFQLKMKASASKTIKVAIVQLQTGGTADTIPTLVSSWNADGTDPTLGTNLATIGTPTTCSVTTSWQTFQVTGTYPSTAKNLLVMVWTNADFSVNDTLSLAEAGLYYGTSLRTWTPRSGAQELQLCKRYYRKSYAVDTVPGTASAPNYALRNGSTTAYIWGDVQFNPEMRTSPAIAIYSANGTPAKVGNLGGGDVGTSVTCDLSGVNQITRLVDSGSGFTAGVIYAYHYTADARL